MGDNWYKREQKHFLKTYRTFIPDKITRDDLAVAFRKGYNASDMRHRGKLTEADNAEQTPSHATWCDRKTCDGECWERKA